MNLAQIVANHAHYQPAKLAIDAGDDKLSYSTLDLLIRQVATRLREAGVGEGDVVGLRLRDTPVNVASLLAVMRLGAVALPLDWRMVPAEVKRLAERFSPKATIDDSPTPVFPTALGIDGLETLVPDEQPPLSLINAPAAYVLTSGTTGEPKAMVVTHEQFYARFVGRTLAGINARDDVYMVPLPIAYPAGREHSLAPLLYGATLVIFPTVFEPEALVEAVNRRRVTGLVLSPNSTRALLGLKRRPGQLLMPGLRAFVSTTGKLQPEERTAIRERINPNLIDYYGASGITPIAVIANERDGRDPTVAGRLSMGIDIEIVGPDDRRVPAGEPGMIRLRGPALIAGFVGTNLSADEGLRNGWYYPGDIGSLDARGLLHLHGRVADLIKRGGLMVHAQEVEQVLRLHPGITDAAVVGIPSPELGEEVAAFVTADRPVEPFAVIRHCRERLAAFKVPSRFAVIDALPRNATGKVIKSELKARPAPRIEAPVAAEPVSVAPTEADDPIEASILALFRRALSNPDVRLDDNFFELGGDSLLAAALMSDIAEEHGKLLSVSTILEAGSARSLAAVVAEAREGRRPSCLVKVQTVGSGVPLVVVHGLAGDVVFARTLAARIGPVRPVFALRGEGLQGGESFADSVPAMVEKYIEDLRRIRPEGPYVVLGYCGGGLAAYEMAQRLRETDEVAALIMIDPPVGWRRAPWLVAEGSMLSFYQSAAQARYGWGQLRTVFRPRSTRMRGFMFTRSFSRSLAHYVPKPFPLETLVIHSVQYEREGMFHPRRGYQRLLPRGSYKSLAPGHGDLFDQDAPTGEAVREFLDRVVPAETAMTERAGTAMAEREGAV